MSIVWQQRIEHFNRPARRAATRRIRKTMRRLELRKRRGMPSRLLSSPVVEDGLWQLGEVLSQEQLAKIRVLEERKLMRGRLLERKREALCVIRSRRVTEQNTCINLWRRRRVWLARVGEMFAGMPANQVHSQGIA